jgi:hypothetical protein
LNSLFRGKLKSRTRKRRTKSRKRKGRESLLGEWKIKGLKGLVVRNKQLILHFHR